MKKLLLFLLTIATILTLTGCGDDSKENYNDLYPETLRAAYSDYFDIGAATRTSNVEIHEEVLKEFSSISAEYEMKWGYVHKGVDTYNFTSTDKLAELAREQHKTIRGHTLVWHSTDTIPDWARTETSTGTTDEKIAKLIKFTLDYFKQMHDRYGDVITCRDIANEIIADSGTNLYRTDSFYYEICETDENFEYFLSEVYKGVEEYAPEVTRYYNDYSLIVNPTKRTKVKTFITNMEKLGASVQGVGMQAHVNINMTKQQVVDAIQDFAKVEGLKVSLTELDVSVYTSSSQVQKEFTESLSNTLANCYKLIFEACRENKDVVECVTMWGVTDDSWLDNWPVTGRDDYPLLFTTDLEKKTAYYSVRDFE